MVCAEIARIMDAERIEQARLINERDATRLELEALKREIGR